MKKVPISLIIDDPAPVVSVYHDHSSSPVTKDGRPILEFVPNALLDAFCDVAQRHGIKGKFSVVPMPGNRGDILNGLQGTDPAEVACWLDTVKRRLVPAFTVGPEMLTHNKAVDLATGKALPLLENQWAATQTQETLTPYIAKALEILNNAGFDAFGVTSPWDFAIDVEKDYVKAISQAVYQVTGKKNAWYFLRGLRNTPNAKPWVALEEEDRCVVSIPATTDDVIWASIDTTDSSEDYVNHRADLLITADGKDGAILRVLETGGWPILITHWQSLMSNGLGTGIQILDTVCSRIEKYLSHRVEWLSFQQILETVLADKAAYPMPDFSSECE